MTTNHAAVAKLAKAYVKNLGLKVSARSSSFAGGTSVSVTVTNARPEHRKAITEHLGQYQYGRFDGMTDCYDYTNHREDIPQVKYLSIDFVYSDDWKQAAYDWALSQAVIYDGPDGVSHLPIDYPSLAHHHELWGRPAQNLVHRLLVNSERFADLSLWEACAFFTAKK